ncbi:hypothetical protein H5410_030133 [Solanum commersonii]|uniref:Zinc finger C3HC4 RING-type domain-containing protein n=1 Tax=Solanum commersonii TaxID=4109 RepID=A0A9J5YDE0_SOLCO|nr:hypothetical protein H5410_030133 [Solanum commersonii]
MRVETLISICNKFSSTQLSFIQVRPWNQALITVLVKTPVEIEYFVIPNSLNLKKSTSKKGESSCAFYKICKNVFPLQNKMMQGTSCNHRYCEECIQNYIGKKINKDIHEIISKKCPAFDCNGILAIDSIMPVDFLMRARDAIRLTEVLASPIVIDYPFMDCIGTLVDDLRECLIKC